MGYRALFKAVSEELSATYHSATHDHVVALMNFPPKRCYQQNLPAESIALDHGARIEDSNITLGSDASMRFLHIDADGHSSVNENSLVARLTLAGQRVLLMGDSEAGPRAVPQTAPLPHSVEGQLLSCCTALLDSDVLVVGHHGSMTSSRRQFLDAVSAEVVSSGPFPYGSVTLPDQEVISELETRKAVCTPSAYRCFCRSRSSNGV